MKRSHESSDSLGTAFMSMCPTAEEHVYNNSSRDAYVSMLDGLDEEEDQGCGGQKKRRLSVDQVKALEKSFEKDKKLEPERKMKLAQDLGLQARQVAVWFQNRRARWKTKQLERDYGLLNSNFDALNHNYESLLHEKQALLNQIKELKSRLQEENLSPIKEEEALLSESCANKNSTNISPAAASLSVNEESELGAKLITAKKKKNAAADFKDGSSDSDSSAILNDDHQILMSPNLRLLNSSNSSTSPASSINCFAISDPQNNNNNVYHPQFVKMEEHNFFGGEEACNFFSDEQAPTLHWYCPDQWN